MATFELEETKEAPPGERKGFDPIADDTIIEAVVNSVEVKPHKFFKDDEGNPEIKVNFEFGLRGEFEGKNRKLWGDTPTTFTTHPDCKLRNWVQQILGGQELPPGFKLNTDDLVNQPVRVVVEYREWKDKDTNETKWRNGVKDLMYSKTAGGPIFEEEPF
jgi:hypothetical protein